MPTYEYECRACGQRFSEFFRTIRSAQESPTPPCPACHSADVERIVSSFAVHGPARADAQQVSAERADAAKRAAITPKEQIAKWRSGKK